MSMLKPLVDQQPPSEPEKPSEIPETQPGPLRRAIIHILATAAAAAAVRSLGDDDDDEDFPPAA